MMAGSSSEESGVSRSLEGLSNGQQRSGEAIAEWRSSEQVENGITSTSPPYWDTDDDDDRGPKPSELYGKYTWKIDKFSQINKRELRSNAFEVGGYKWYILIYPQGCDVCNHLSLFLCVANHDKLLPGWSHFAQFTIAVVNKDPKKSKYSDTLHRFWKKEHDWGWKKFMELSKVLDGFVDADTLIIKAQVQVIRERADRPFRCLDTQYRRELVRVYLSNVEQICRRFVEERRGRLGKLIEDKVRWSSFSHFWSTMDQISRRRMSREKSESVLKVVVKQFFIEKEVTSTLVMDSLYSGLRALEAQAKSKKVKGKCDTEEVPIPVVLVESDTFILVDDVLVLLERAALEPLPPKDDKGPQNRTKDGGSGEDISKDSIERDERRLTELGRRTIEIFVLAHIFTKIEVAYQEAVALKRQEELIREEEEAWMAESEQKAKRASEKEKKSKKKQAKQKRNNRKSKDKGRDEKHCVVIEEKTQQLDPIDVEDLLKKPEIVEDVSDVSDSVDCGTEAFLRPDSDDRDSSPVNWDTDTSEPHPPTEACSSGAISVLNGWQKSPSAMDDSSSTCSSDSLPSGVINGPYRGDSHQNQKSQSSPSRGKVKQGKAIGEVTGQVNNVQKQHATNEVESGGVAVPLQDRMKWLEQDVVKKVEEVVTLQKKLSIKDEVEPEKQLKVKIAVSVTPSSPKSISKASPRGLQKSDLKKSVPSDSGIVRKPSTENSQNADKQVVLTNSSEGSVISKPHTQSTSNQKLTEKPSIVPQAPNSTQKPVNVQGSLTAEKSVVHQVSKTLTKSVPTPPMSRPLSAPLVEGSRTNATSNTPVISMVQTTPFLSRSASATGYLGPDPSPMAQSYGPPSYRNAMMGSPVSSTSTAFSQAHSHSYTQPVFLPQTPERMDSNNSVGPSFSYGMMNHDVVIQNGSQWMASPQRDNNSGRSFAQGMMADEFPHLDIINDLLDDEYAMPIASTLVPGMSFHSGPRHLSHQFTFPGDISGSLDHGPSTSSCRFDRTRSFHEEFQPSYSSGYDFSRDMLPPQPNLQPYVNGQIDGSGQNQWQIGGSDLSYGLRNMDSDGYTYHMSPDYSNLTMGVNGYTVYRPSNGQ
uniref:TNF receptor-associated factor homolog 1a-like isoform X2 n=1 Tax=Erigeron canadensis TaxID=72917 RepID=UPI001CB930F9|nr:TNF receptor-associated factor homolog 1a-like isoform X2 [Erigeron canadensis]